MFKTVTTLTEFVLEDEKKFKDASGNFTLLLLTISNACKIIASHLRHSGLVDILGKTGTRNTYGDEVERLDEFANQLLTDMLLKSGFVYAVMSEEFEKPHINPEKTGEYIVCFDPLDGSSNIDVNITLGTIFSIYRKTDELLQPGKQQLAAGYALYGPSTMFVYSSGNGVHGFTMDPTIGSFLLSHPLIKMPEKGNVLAFDASHAATYPEKEKNFVTMLQDDGYKQRYVGAMVSDVHRILLQGGVFAYPAFMHAPTGKLRLLFEVNPLSFLVEQASGVALSDTQRALDIVPTSLDQTVPIILGSKKEMSALVNKSSH